MKQPIVPFEVLKKDTWSEKENGRAVLVSDFVQKLMNEHDFSAVVETFGHGGYKQHNRSMEDGLSGVVESLRRLTKRFPEFSYDVKKIHVDGAYVTLHSHATVRARDRGNEKKGMIIFDTWKIENGKIVEHWDALQPLDVQMRLFTLFTGGAIRNKNGIF